MKLTLILWLVLWWNTVFRCDAVMVRSGIIMSRDARAMYYALACTIWTMLTVYLVWNL